MFLEFVVFGNKVRGALIATEGYEVLVIKRESVTHFTNFIETRKRAWLGLNISDSFVDLVLIRGKKKSYHFH